MKNIFGGKLNNALLYSNNVHKLFDMFVYYDCYLENFTFVTTNGNSFLQTEQKSGEYK